MKLITPILSHHELVAVQVVREHFELRVPEFNGAVIQIVQSTDAVCCSVEGCDELAGALLLAGVNTALDDVQLAADFALFENHDEEIEQLKSEAFETGDDALLVLCHRALDGDEQAKAECHAVIDEARIRAGLEVIRPPDE